MRQIRFFIACMLLSVFFGLSGNEALAQNTDRQCVPSESINPSTQVPCGSGYTGVKFKKTIVSCPGNKVTQSSEYDTSQCVPVGTGGQVNPCVANPSLCIGTPLAQGCPTGKHWTMQGLPYAHCVSNDPVCGWGTTLQHDGVGEPSCVPNTCPSNQVLQADGVSCACPSGTSWNGSSCVVTPPVVTCPLPSVRYLACPSGFTGQIVRTKSYTVVNGACTPQIDDDDSGCTPVVTPPVVCPQDKVTNGVCPSGYSGQTTITTSYSVINGACVPSVFTDKTNCVKDPIPCPADTSVPGACQSGYTGQSSINTVYTLVNGVCKANTSTDYSGCSPIVVPPVVTCPDPTTSYSNCPSPQTGQIATTTTYSLVNGACVGKTGTPDTSGCVNPVVCPQDSSVEGTCPPGTSGTAYIKTTYKLINGACTSNTQLDTSGCIADPPPPPCDVDGIPYLASNSVQDKNNPAILFTTVARGTTLGGYCTGVTKNQAWKFTCSVNGALTIGTYVLGGCDLFN